MIKKQLEKKLFYILPGFGESPRMAKYKAVASFAKNKGYKVIPVEVDWREGKTITKYIKEIKETLGQVSKDSSALGFSFGANFLAILIKEIKFKKIFFCSLSPYFKDDIPHLPMESKKYFGKKFINDAKKYSFPNGSKADAFFLVGDKEPIISISRTENSFWVWKGKKKKIIIPNADHDIGEKKYLEAIKKLIIK